MLHLLANTVKWECILMIYFILKVLLKRMSTITYDKNVYVSMRFDLFRGLWWSSGKLTNQKYLSHSPLPESRISYMMPQFCTKTSSMSIYGHIWWRLIYKHALWTCFRVYGVLQGQTIVKNKTKIADFAHKALKSNMVHLSWAETSLNGYYWQKWWKMECQYSPLSNCRGV